MTTLIDSLNNGPTAFDSLNNFAGDLHGMNDWQIVIGRNRDSDILTESNFQFTLNKLGGESDNVKILRFGHWACGWYELLAINPSYSEGIAIGEDIQEQIENYPVLDDDDFSRREWEAKEELWNSCFDHKYKVELCHCAGVDGRKAKCKYIPSDVDMYIEIN